jgi:hypothetical protein
VGTKIEGVLTANAHHHAHTNSSFELGSPIKTFNAPDMNFVVSFLGNVQGLN